MENKMIGAFSKSTLKDQGLQPTYQLVPLQTSLALKKEEQVEITKPKPTVLEEDEYFSYLEEIIKRDYFPDLLKMEAYSEYLDKKQAGAGLSVSTARSGREQNALPSVILRETPVDPAIFDRRDPLEKYLDQTKQSVIGSNTNILCFLKFYTEVQYYEVFKITKYICRTSLSTQCEIYRFSYPSLGSKRTTKVTSYEEAIEQSIGQKKSLDISKHSLDDYLTKYTSEDNQSFSELNARDREDFRKKIAWMFTETEKHNRLNQLALENGRQNMLLQDEKGKVRSLPPLQLSEHTAQSQLFFRRPGEDLARAHDLQVAIREAWADVNVGNAVQRIAKSNCRFSSEYLVGFLDQDKKHNRSGIREEFERPLNKDVLNGVFKRQHKPQQEPSLELSDLLAKNRGEALKPKPVEQTPMVNGFKMVPATPLMNQQATTFRRKPIEEASPMITWGKIEDAKYLGKHYQVPQTPARDELGIKMANQALSKRREQKANDKVKDQKSLSEAGKKLLDTIIREKSGVRKTPQVLEVKKTPILKK